MSEIGSGRLRRPVRGPRRVAVVGASRAGLSAVLALRKRGYDGEVVLVGAERRLPYDRPALSKGLLVGTLSPDDLALCALEELSDVELVLGVRATALDISASRVSLDTGAALSYDRLVVATGARARQLMPGPLPRGLHLLRTMDDSLALRDGVAGARRLVIIGGGFIGCEVTATLSGGDLEICLIEAGPTLLAQQLGDKIGAAATARHREHGIEVICGVGVEAVQQRAGAVAGVRLTDGRTIAADVVVVGIGVMPNVDWLPTPLLDERRSVKCEPTMRCAPNVYAVGDVASWVHPLFRRRMRVEHWTNAHEQARVAVENMLGGDRISHAAVPYVWSDQYGSRIQVYGDLSDVDASATLHGSVDDWRFVEAYGRRGRLVAVVGVDMGREALHLRRGIARGARWAELAALT